MVKMKTVPQVRNELLKIAADLRSWDAMYGYSSGEATNFSHKIKRLVKSLHRRKAVRRATQEHAAMTPSLTAEIKAYATAHPTTSYAVIGHMFNVAIGRVSEAVAGKRAA